MYFIYNFLKDVFVYIYTFFNHEVEIDHKTPIEHVVLLMLENRSFDQIFGCRNDYPKPYTVNGITNSNSKDQTTRLFTAIYFKMGQQKLHQIISFKSIYTF